MSSEKKSENSMSYEISSRRVSTDSKAYDVVILKKDGKEVKEVKTRVLAMKTIRRTAAGTSPAVSEVAEA